ncbi:glutactin-like [Topomyia yanbarensis]|uniref:glutactin-like n=1 Tax=Topomyia yanbarensis TaxID=2498891 RepID=UPI00273CD084|nr:glutactin-like [Topomyia yanbarensis]
MQLLLNLLLLTTLFQLRACLHASSEAPEVTLPKLGSLRGSTTVSAFSRRTILQFLSIRYGETTAGEFRFKAPRKALPWSGFRNVSQFGTPCPQQMMLLLFPKKQFVSDVEDCLTLSVYTGDLSAKTPVMVFLQGRTTGGSSSKQTPEFLLEKNIVLVVVQYRFGPFGFLSLKTETMPGNVGLLDIKLALEWIRDNIAEFGGDCENVTLFGQSAGAAAISALMYSPQIPDNLFHKVILQSGASSSPWVWDKDPVGNALKIAVSAGCSDRSEQSEEVSENLRKIEHCLREMDVWHLMRSFIDHKMQTTRAKGLSEVGGNRFIVGDFHGFLPRTPWDQIRGGNIRRNLPMMAGVVKHEGTFLLTTIYDSLKSPGLLDSSNFIKIGLLDRVNRILGIDDPTGTLLGYQIRSLFSSAQVDNGTFEVLVDGLIDLIGTALIKAPVFREVQVNGLVNPNRTFLYSFDYRGKQTRFGYGADTSHYPFTGGVHHSDDLLYLFPFPPGEPSLIGKDREMAQLMVDLWTSFAAVGIPTSIRSTVDWKPMSDYAGPYLHIDEQSRLGTNFYEEFSIASDESRKPPEA